MDNRQLLLRGLPKIDELLLDEQLVFFMESTPRSVVVDAAREIIDELREREILSGEREDTPEKDELIAEICESDHKERKREISKDADQRHRRCAPHQPGPLQSVQGWPSGKRYGCG